MPYLGIHFLCVCGMSTGFDWSLSLVTLVWFPPLDLSFLDDNRSPIYCFRPHILLCEVDLIKASSEFLLMKIRFP